MTYFSRRTVFLLVVMAVAGLVLVYPPTRLISLLWPDWPVPFSLMAAFLALPMILRVLHEQTNHAWSRAISAVVMTWLGICFVMLCLILLAEAILLLPVPSKPVGQGVAVLVVLISAYGVFNAHRLHVHQIQVPADAPVKGLRLAQISDVHIGSRQPDFLKPIVKRLNALEPDYVLITGDLIDMAAIDVDSLAPLADLKAPTLFCIGNHERYVDLEAICQRLSSLGIDVLRNRSVDHNGLQFIGIDDAESRTQVAREIKALSATPDAFRILLYHRPDGAEEAAAWGVHLMLTGHTHRGQIVPFNFLVQRVFPRLYRDYKVDGMCLYVSPGTGTWGPVMRLGSKCEITLIELL
ncbi:MAG: metallophosphoesterase [bacterium]